MTHPLLVGVKALTLKYYLAAQLCADDWGVFPAKPGWLVSRVFPFQPPRQERVQSAFDELLLAGVLHEFVGPDGQRYFQDLLWDGLQGKPPSKRSERMFPKPPDKVLDLKVGGRQKGRNCAEPNSMLGQGESVMERDIVKPDPLRSKGKGGCGGEGESAAPSPLPPFSAKPPSEIPSSPAEKMLWARWLAARMFRSVSDVYSRMGVRAPKKFREAESNPTSTAATRLKKDWTNQMRLMISQDDLSPAEILDMFTWAHNDDFWFKNILSPRKLRKQMNNGTLSIQRASRGRGNSTTPERASSGGRGQKTAEQMAAEKFGDSWRARR